MLFLVKGIIVMIYNRQRDNLGRTQLHNRGPTTDNWEFCQVVNRYVLLANEKVVPPPYAYF